MNRVAGHEAWRDLFVAACLVACVDCGGRTPLDDWSVPPAVHDSGATDAGAESKDSSPDDADAEAPFADAGAADAHDETLQDSGPTCVPPRITRRAPTLVAETADNVGPFWGHSALGLFWNQGVPNAGCYDALLWLKNGATEPTRLPFDCASLVAIGPSAVYLALNHGRRVDAFGERHQALENIGNVGAPSTLAIAEGQLISAERVGSDVEIASEPTPLGRPRWLTTFPGARSVSLISDGTRLFAAIASRSHDRAELYEVDVQNGAQRAIATIDNRPFVAGGGYVYQNRERGGIEQIDVATGEKSVAVSDRFSANAGVADARYFYFTDVRGDIYRRAHCGGQPQLVASHVHALLLQQDDQYLYWWTGLAIVRLEKPP